MKDMRYLVAQALCKMERDKSWSNLVLDAALREQNTNSRDSAFASALFYGVLERMVTLDACIAAHSSVKLRKLSLPVHTALRLGVYQMLYMDSVPDNAAVAESVELVKKMRQHKSTGFVNAVLRAFLRGGKQLPIPVDGPPEQTLSVEYSCPAPLVRLWLDSYGHDVTLRILERSLGRPPLTVRANTCRTTPEKLAALLEGEGVTARPDPAVPGCLELSATGTVQGLDAYKQGLFHVQDRASQLCAMALDPQPGMAALDACAAPGGKSFTMAQLMGDKGRLVAADLYPHRTALIAKRAVELGLSCIQPTEADMAEPQADLGEFDRVLCDVPCSGLGVIRRKPEIKYKPLEEFAEFPSIQYKILETSAHYCKKGGKLIYSTCTLNPAENLAVVEKFLGNHADFVPCPLHSPEGVPAGLFDGAWHKTLLDDLDADGFFLACLQRG